MDLKFLELIIAAPMPWLNVTQKAGISEGALMIAEYRFKVEKCDANEVE